MGKQPIAIDLFCGMGGWTIGLKAVGYRVIGFDIVRWPEYPGEIVLQDVATIDGRMFRALRPALIVASPPCQAYSYRAMPWKRAKALPPPDNTLFEACFRIAREAGCPLVVENVKGAQPWVGRARWHFGPMYLWGDVPPLMPIGVHRKGTGGSWFSVIDGRQSQSHWRDSGCKTRVYNSKDPRRKRIAAEIAMIPFELARWIGECYWPTDTPRVAAPSAPAPHLAPCIPER